MNNLKLILIITLIVVTTFGVQAKDILIVAPHPDDEIIGTGGTISQHLQQGDQVKVIFMTSGEGYYWARKLFSKKIVTNLEELIEFATIRRQESITALTKLGLDRKQIKFLKFPDGYLKEIFLNGNFYSLTRQELVTDLEREIINYKPDIIYTSHLNDQHPDHWVTALITKLILAKDNLSIPHYHYLVHWNDYPQPRGYNPDSSLQPPTELISNLTWNYHHLSSQAVKKKYRSIKSFKTQFLIQDYLHSFIRQNELFATFEPINLPQLVSLKHFKEIILKTEKTISKDNTNSWLQKGDIINLAAYNTIKNLYLSIKFKSKPADKVKVYLINPKSKQILNKFTYFANKKNEIWGRINNRLYLKINKEGLTKEQIIGVISYEGNSELDIIGWYSLIIN
ncbi:hypothetical protein JCM16358_02580 [Halanaerocella petrolearia]